MKTTDHYTKKPIKVRALTLAAVKRLLSGETIHCIGNDGVVRVRVNGEVKRWKRDKDRVRVSLKYGLYEHLQIDNSHIGNLAKVGCPVCIEEPPSPKGR